MPKKPKKSKEEKVAEEYFPIDEDDLKNTTEKSVKESAIIKSRSTIEKEYKKPKRDKIETIEKKAKHKKRTRKKTIKKEYTPQKINLKKDGYELIITEKPQAALKIANALGNPKKRDFKNIPYYEVNRKGQEIIVACAVGHLFTLTQNSKGSEVPRFDISWMPNYLVRKRDFTKKYFDTLINLAKNAGSLTVATDFDVEGELIGLNIIRFICNQKDANRMKFSTLTKKELNQSYEKKLKQIKWGQAIAGETRHYLDWFYGINISRALMNAIKTTGKFKIMSTGRVQGPALSLIVKKEREIQNFKSKPYWQIFINVKNSHEIELKHNKDIFDKSELKKFDDLIRKTAQAKTTKREQIIPPNPPFNLTTLQTESYRLYGITPSNTLKAAQSLYLAGLISYPRTSSQKLPEEIGYKEILKKLSKKYKTEHLTTKNKPIEGKKSDPAHPSIYPTGNTQILSSDEEKVYNLIVKRFLALFCENAIINNKTITAVVDNLKFLARGTSIKKKSWMEIYPMKITEKDIPDLDGEVKITNIKKVEKQTQPPKRYSPASIVSELEKKNLGTKATRAAILETLYSRGYVKEKSIQATPLGISLISTMEKYSPIIIDEKLTRDFEKQMESLIGTKKLLKEKEKEIIEKSKQTIIQIAKQFENNEKEIGKELIGAVEELRAQEKITNTLMKCPVCNKGNLAITYSRKTRRHFVACDAYPNCKTTYSLPPNGIIKKTGKICDKCGFPKLMRLSKGKRPWEFCFNPSCSTNKEWAKKREEKRVNENL